MQNVHSRVWIQVKLHKHILLYFLKQRQWWKYFVWNMFSVTFTVQLRDTYYTISMNISYDLIGNYTHFSLFVQLLLKVYFLHWSLNRLYSQSSFNEVMSVHPFISTCPQGHWEDWAEFTHCMSPALLLWKEGRKTHFEFRFALSRMRRSIYGKRLCFLQRSEFCPCK